MAKQIVAWCDVHLAQDEQVPASPVQVAIDQGLPVEVDLCDPCRKELVDPLAELLTEHGQPVKKGAQAPSGESVCGECGKSYRQPASLRRHMREVHEAPPVPDGRSNVVPDGYPCPDCERTFDRPQALGRHRAHQHGYKAPRGKKGGKG